MGVVRNKYLCSSNINLRFKPLVSKRYGKYNSGLSPKTHLKLSYGINISILNPFSVGPNPTCFSKLTTYHLPNTSKVFHSLENIFEEIQGKSETILVLCMNRNILHRNTEKVLSVHKSDFIIGYTNQKGGVRYFNAKALKSYPYKANPCLQQFQCNSKM